MVELHEGNKASIEARRLGLVYKNFGRWANPVTGEITHKTIDNDLPTERLIRIDKDNDERTGGGHKSYSKRPSGSHDTHRKSKSDRDGDGQDDSTEIRSVNKKAKRPNYRKWKAGFKGDTLAEATGNPTPGGPLQDPGTRAKQMGLQSDGHGNYVDSSGNKVAKTVNGELVFFDANGGVTDDSSTAGEKQLPSHTDPKTGLVILPAAKPADDDEKPKDDVKSFKPPVGYREFIEKEKLKRKGGVE